MGDGLDAILHQSGQPKVSSISRQRMAMGCEMLGERMHWVMANQVIGAKSGGRVGVW